MVARDSTVEERLTTVERIQRDHAKSLTAAFEALTSLKEAERLREIREAEDRVRAENRGRQLTHIEERLSKIEGTGSKLLWIVIGSVVLAFLAFVYRGGLMLP